MTLEPIPNLFNDPLLIGFAQRVALVFARVAPIVSFTPLFGGAAVPRRLRVGLSLLLVVGMMPIVGGHGSPDPVPGGRFVALAVKEAVIGFVLGFGVGIFFDTVAAFGSLIDLSRGVTFSSLLDPIHGNQASPLSAFYSLLVVTAFLSLGGYRLLVWALADSFQTLPPTAFVPATLLTGVTASVALQAVGYLLLTTLKLAAPVLLTLLLIDVALGLINRVAPQVSAYFLGQETKAWVGLLVAAISLALVARLLPTELARVLGLLMNMTRALQPAAA